MSTVRYTPFFVADASASPATLTDATYQTNGLAVGVMIGEKGKYDLECRRISATYTKSAQEIALRFTDCLGSASAPIVSSKFEVIGTIGLNTDETTMTFVELGVDGLSTGSAQFKVESSEYKFGGPTGGELVGAVTLKSPKVQDPLLLTLAFGAKK
jgi:hypothetical protein